LIKTAPNANAAKPNIIKTVDNPKTKANAINPVPEELLELRLLGLDFIPAIDVPAINARYGGTIGKTHGDKKLSVPAKNAITRELSIDKSVSSCPNIVSHHVI
tara:strand:- start:54 stop:362 length:309 start_codon:yes stop_codon:yes gene_type:complete